MGRLKVTSAVFLIIAVGLVSCAKQQVQLSDSYLPVAMQIIAHLTDQMAFEVKDDVTPTPRPSTSRPATTPTKPATTTTRPTTTTAKPTTTKPLNDQQSWTTTRPTWTTTRPTWTTSKPTTSRPYVTSSSYPGAFKPTTNGWWMSFTTSKRPETTPFHRPGIYAPFSPPKPFINRYQSRNFLLPMYNVQYTVLGPEETRPEDPFLSIHEEEIKPLVEPIENSGTNFLPPNFDVKISSRSDGFTIDSVDEENLQYLADDVKEMIKMAKNPHDERVVDVWERSGPQPVTTKAKLSSSNLRLLLLYDLLSREAKRLRLSDYSGFSPDVMKVLVESSTGGAREQLRTALSKMVDRNDCGHEYANNRAKEMVEELARDESKLSSEIRYLQPLIYKY